VERTWVVFDLGGVLVRICRSWDEACVRAGVGVRPGWETVQARGARKDLSGAYHDGSMETEEFCARVAATVPGLYTPEEVRRVHDAWLIEEYAGVRALIDELHGRGVTTGILSNTNAAHWERMHRAGDPGREATFGVVSRVHHPHASHLLRCSKPDVACYRAFESRAGVRPGAARVVFFDDLEENVAAAVAAGWEGVRVDHTGDTAAQMRAALERAGVLGRVGGL
jgi:putative hydrolase of the HAD superfamily